MSKKKQAKKPLKKEQTEDECSGCYVNIWRCTSCHTKFKHGDKVFCIMTGEEHLCDVCYKTWLIKVN